ncbi:MAG: hypothetical protein WA045_03580, partial [Nitrospira sp.]
KLRLTDPSLELQRAQITEALIRQLAIIEPFNKHKDLSAHFLPAANTSGGSPAACSQVPTLDGLLGSTHRVWFPHIFFTSSLKLALETTDILERNHRR